MRRFHLIANGLGAGNIGDELMFRAFWRAAPDSWRFDVPLFPESKRQRAPYPPEHCYLDVNFDGVEESETPGLLVGTTLVTEAEGTAWPLAFLARRLDHFHSRGLPVDVVGGGVDRLRRRDARELFARSFSGIRSWSVRSEADREALLDLGVAESAVVTGADWGWLYEPAIDRDWAARQWRRLGVDPERPLIVANVAHHANPARLRGKAEIARALDGLSRIGFQIAFFSNEARDAFDAAAARDTMILMARKAVLVPNEYYSPDEAISLLAFAQAAVSERYHFTMETVLAGSMPVSVVRGQKMRTLCAELGLEPAGGIDDPDGGEIARQVEAGRGGAGSLADRVAALRLRAAGNLNGLLGAEIRQSRAH